MLRLDTFPSTVDRRGVHFTTANRQGVDATIHTSYSETDKIIIPGVNGINYPEPKVKTKTLSDVFIMQQ